MFLQKSRLKANLKKSRNDESIKASGDKIDMSIDNYKFGYLIRDKQVPFNHDLNNVLKSSKYIAYDSRPYDKIKAGPTIGYNNPESPHHISQSTVSYIRDIVKQDSFIPK
jgi:hypothetical protein